MSEPAAEWVDIEALTPWRDNPRKNEHAVDAVAESIKRFGFAAPIIARTDGEVIAGHTRLKAAQALGLDRVPVRYMDLDPADAKLLALAVNKVGELAEWDDDRLSDILNELHADGVNLDGLGFSLEELSEIMALGAEPPEEEFDITAPDPNAVIHSKLGQVYELGPHRLMCGDSTDPDMVQKLMAGEQAELLHADPPYGMGKESEGVLNDNLYKEKLDAFQMEWIRVWFVHLSQRASFYIWGNAEDLWRLWYCGGLSKFDELTMRNELVWDKISVPGMGSALSHSYPPATERCLFMMRGQQFLGNLNKEDYWEGNEPLRLHLVTERDKCGWTNKDVNKITGTHMAGHWFTKSQFQPISRKHYEALQAVAKGSGFLESYDELFGVIFDGTVDGLNSYKRNLSEKLREERSYFDGEHEAMTDVWQYGRVVGEERFDHATPKNVDMIARICKTSAPENAWIAEPFGGTGTTLIAATMRGRRCAIMELDPGYCDVIRRRWTAYAKQAGIDPGAGALDEAE